MILNETELLNILHNEGLNAFLYEQCVDIGCIHLKSNDINELINYAKANQIKNIFYCYNYLDKEDYLFNDYVSFLRSQVNPLMHYEDYIDDLLKLAKTDIANYKSIINSINFNKFASLVLICLYNGTAIVMDITEPQYKSLKTAKEFFDTIKLKYNETLKDRETLRYKEKQKQKESTLEELGTIILSDSKFAECTNHNLRSIYIKDLLNNPDNSRFREAFMSEIGCVTWYEAKSFVDQLYKQLKIKS